MKVAVIGDSIIDEYIECEVNRISPEAPVPVARINNKRTVPGGALNTAINFSLLGAETWIFSRVGEDFSFDSLPFETKFLTRLEGQPTTRKSRVCCDNKQLIRLDVDRNCQQSLDRSAIEALLNEKFDVIALSDYGLGMLQDDQMLADLLKKLQSRCFLALDPHPRNIKLVWRLARYGIELELLKPNSSEFQKIASNFPGVVKPYDLLAQSRFKRLLITRGREGMTCYNRLEEISHPAIDVPVFDVSGAGDAVFASFISELYKGTPVNKALAIATLAAQTVITKFGTATLDPRQLEQLKLENL